MKTLLRWFFCMVAGVLMVAVGYELLGDPARDMKINAMFIQPAIAQGASRNVLLVNAANPLPNGFVADRLVNLYDEKRSFQLMNSGIRLAWETFEAANRMFEQACQDGVSGFILTSGYRSEEKQRELYENSTDGTAAIPGASEHQTGLSFDVTAHYDNGSFEDTEQFRWLMEHCWSFGFILRYPQGKEHITGIPYEPWHYRYVGAEAALEIRQNGWTLEEYCQSSPTVETSGGYFVF